MFFASIAAAGEAVAGLALTGKANMTDYERIFTAITNDPRYLRNLDWGDARPGHQEGTVQAHISEIERNLDVLRPRLSESDYWKLRILVHTHDTFKADADPGVAISASNSHASLARAFLSEFCGDPDVLAIAQYHDEPFALWRQLKSKGTVDAERFYRLLSSIQDWNLFLAFNIIDGCVPGKSREPLRWLFKEFGGRVRSTFGEADILSDEPQ
jgi:hypothetical protein